MSRDASGSPVRSSAAQGTAASSASGQLILLSYRCLQSAYHMLAAPWTSVVCSVLEMCGSVQALSAGNLLTYASRFPHQQGLSMDQPLLPRLPQSGRAHEHTLQVIVSSVHAAGLHLKASVKTRL